MTPATAFVPYSDEPEPRSTSMRSVSTVERLARNAVASPWGLAGSRKRMPSTSTAVSWLRRPRVLTAVKLPGAPRVWTRRPGTVRRAPATDRSLRRAISSESMTSRVFAASCTTRGAPVPVTTTSVARPDTCTVEVETPVAGDGHRHGRRQRAVRPLRLEHVAAGGDAGERVAAVRSAGRHART